MTNDESKDRIEEILNLLDGLRDIGIELDGSVSGEDSIDYVIEDLKSNIDHLHEFVPTLDDVPLETETTDIVVPEDNIENQQHLSGPAAYYCRKIRDRFPLLDSHLVERLGLASWQRHNRVRETLNAVATVSLFEDDGPTFQSEGQTLAEFRDSGLGTTLRTASKYSGSQASYQSCMSSRADIQNGHTRLPTLPSEALAGKPFICSVCGGLVRNIKNKLQWRQV